MRIWFGDDEAPPGWETLRAAWQVQAVVRRGLVSIVNVPPTQAGFDLWAWITGAAVQGLIPFAPIVELRAETRLEVRP